MPEIDIPIHSLQLKSLKEKVPGGVLYKILSLDKEI
jgi:hypothetical protein